MPVATRETLKTKDERCMDAAHAVHGHPGAGMNPIGKLLDPTKGRSHVHDDRQGERPSRRHRFEL